MTRLIDADVLKARLVELGWITDDPFAEVGDLEEIIDEAPTVEMPHGEWVQCSDRLPTAEDGERVLVHLSFDKPACEYVYIPWKTVGFEYQVGHIDAWFAIPKYEKRGESE